VSSHTAGALLHQTAARARAARLPLPASPLLGRQAELGQLHSLLVGERTVETHVHSVLRKLGLRSRFQVTDWAASQGLPGQTAAAIAG
jgi:hypothetical protein